MASFRWMLLWGSLLVAAIACRAWAVQADAQSSGGSKPSEKAAEKQAAPEAARARDEERKQASALRPLLEAKYAGVSRAFQKKDVPAMLEITTPDFVSRQPGGHEMSRADVEADFKRQVEAAQSVSWKRKIEDLAVHDGEAVATVHGDFRATVLDASHKKHKMQFDAHTRDTWMRQDNDWKLRLSELLKAEMTLDGKPVGGGHR